MKILIVDDDFLARQFLLTILQNNNECHIAMNGEDAMELFNLSVMSSQPFDIILLDIVMPIMNGHQVIEKVRETEKHYNIPKDRMVKIVITSAKDDAQHKIKSLKAGADKYLTKPLSPQKVISIIKSFNIHKE